MSWLRTLSTRFVVLLLVWSLPLLLYLILGLVALYQAGWLHIVFWTLPPLWLLAWVISKVWAPPKLKASVLSHPLKAPEFWTPHDAAAIELVEQYRSEAPAIDRASIADPNRYFRDAQALADRLARHYHPELTEGAYTSLTVVEILAVIHLSVEDLEQWLLDNIPGSDLATVGHLEQIPALLKAVDVGQTLLFLASAVIHPGKLLSYPLWRKSGSVTVELQNELIRGFYQVYLRQVGYYLIEMYSGRLKGGSRRYRQRFGHMAAAVHVAGGDATLLSGLEDVNTSIAVMGQVKAGKSSLINALMKDKVAAISVLPQTREVQRYDYRLAESHNVLSLLDTPGYSEADVTQRQRNAIKSAAELADIILLVMAANSPARDADVQVVRELANHYREHPHLRPPPIIAVLTHIDLLRPVREWSPPYDWRHPTSEKERSIASAVAYTRELFGDSIAAYACVYTGEIHPPDASVAEEVVPHLVEHLTHGHSAAILKAFYEQLSRDRFQQLARQVVGLLKNIGRSLVE
jgi:predicted GTPase